LKGFSIVLNNLSIRDLHQQKLKNVRQKDRVFPMELIEKSIQVTVIFPNIDKQIN